MSTTAKSNNNTNEPVTPISEAEDVKMFQAARRNGRRNALGDLSEQLAQGEFDFHTKFSRHFFFCSRWFKFIF
jgi:hypothetical protein